ncbi:QRIC2-like protein [Mya arenaria]|uniref:QRIC2-like protein n=1 Tax=Mya arenaria TaxID=6604 RepID=A0ABY7DJ01_MYAAR|nr:QRIC2-like protein [Mya arenaria]
MPTSVSLAQMVDLSLGTPEIGVVNFNVMHSLLHAIIKKLNISDARTDINEHDRDFLATSKIRARSTLSDADSGRGEESEDGLSEKSAPAFRPTPYHRLEIKVEKLFQQMEELNKLPSNSELFDRATKAKVETGSDRPVADMWQYMQLKKRVDANEEGVGKLFSLIEDMMKEMKELRDANQLLQDKIKGLNVDDLKKRLQELEKVTGELNDKFALLPTPEELSQFVTWPSLEDALKGIRDDLTPQQQQERIVIEMSSQTEPPSRPGSSRPMSRVSTPGPSEQLLDILERLGRMDSDHQTLKARVDALEEELKNKLDKSAIQGLGVPAELLEQIGKLQEDLDALAAQRDKTTDAPSQKGALSLFGSVVAMVSKIRMKKHYGDTSTDTEKESSDEENIGDFMPYNMQVFEERLKVLEDRFRLFQQNIIDDSAYQSEVTDLSGWLAQMESKIQGNRDTSSPEESEVNSGKEEAKPAEKAEEAKPAEKDEEAKPAEKAEEAKEPKQEEQVDKKKKKQEESVAERLNEEAELRHELEVILDENDIQVTSSQILLSAPELQATNEKLKKMAYSLNDQLHSLRDQVFLVDQEIKRMAKGVEFALMRAKVAGGRNDMDSDALSRAQQAILQLQAEVEKLHHTTSDIIDDSKYRTKQIEDLLKYCDKLQEEKADKDYVQMEVDVTTEEINNMIKEILDKLAGHDEDWKKSYAQLAEDIDGKLDRLELDPLKEWMEARLKALNDKLKKYQQNTDWSEDDAAGIRKQLIQKFHCISCDRPVDMMPTGPIPSLPAQQGLNATKSPRPYTTFELDQIRQHAKSNNTLQHYLKTRYNSGQNVLNFERAIAEKQLASLKKSDLRAFFVHFKNDFDALSQLTQNFTNPEISDYYATPRPCGGSHTLTYPHKRNTKLTHLSHLFREEEAVTIPAPREEVDIQGHDGHIYRGRSDNNRYPQKLEARFPSTLGSNNNNNMGIKARSTSPQPHPYQPKPPQTAPIMSQQRGRPVSARTPPSPRPSSAGQALQQGSRPQSAKPSARGAEQTTVVVEQTATQQVGEPVPEQTIQLDMPSAETAVH